MQDYNQSEAWRAQEIERYLLKYDESRRFSAADTHTRKNIKV